MRRGEKYGRTDDYIYDIEQVLCIFEVKKKLTKSTLSDAIKHLAEIRQAYTEYFNKKLETGQFIPNIEDARYNFAKLTGKEGPKHYCEIENLSTEEATLFYTLVQESLSPINIIHGYEGYKTEEGLRKVLIDIIEEKFIHGDKSYGIPSIPTIITSNEYSLIKTSGNPFIVMKDHSEWVSVVSTRFNSAEIILETVWSKISKYFSCSMPWDDGIYMNNLSPLLVAKVGVNSEGAGWIYNTMEFKERSLLRKDEQTWSPEKIEPVHMSMLKLMMIYGELLLSAENESYFKDNYSIDFNKEVSYLTQTQLFMLTPNSLKPINRITVILELEDGSGYIAAERDRLNKWCELNNISGGIMTLVNLD